jgi:hypothetical protein
MRNSWNPRRFDLDQKATARLIRIPRKDGPAVRNLLALALVGCFVALGCKTEGPATGPKGGDAQPTKSTDARKEDKMPPVEAKRKDVEIVPEPLVLKKGEKKKWQINVKRSGGYDKEFSITVSADAGITIPDEIKVPASKDSTQTVVVEVAAAADAKGKPTVTLIGMPPGFEDPKSARVEVTIDK